MDTEQQCQSLETLLDGRPMTTRTLNQRCSDAYWSVDSDHPCSDSERMAEAIAVIAHEIEGWAIESDRRGAPIVALAITGVAQRLRERARD